MVLEFEVKTDGLRASAEQFRNLSRQTSAISRQVSNVMSNMRQSVSIRLASQFSRAVICTNINNCANDLNTLYDKLDYVSSLYTFCERKVLQKNTSLFPQLPIFYVVNPIIQRIFRKEFLTIHNVLHPEWVSPFLLAASGNGEESSNGDKSFFDKLKDGELKGAVLSGEASAAGKFLSTDYEVGASGELIGGSVSASAGAKWNPEDGDAGIEAKIKAEGHLAKGEVHGSYGPLSAKASGTVGSVAAAGSIGATLYKDGKFSPSVGANVEASAEVASGNVETSFGNEAYNHYSEAKGSVLGAKANAGVNAGVITYERDGKTVTEAGLSANVGAEAYLAKGSVSSGFTIGGVKIGATVSGKAGAVGAKASANVSTGGFSVDAGLSALLGVEVELNVDWSGFSWEKLKFWER